MITLPFPLGSHCSQTFSPAVGHPVPFAEFSLGCCAPETSVWYWDTVCPPLPLLLPLLHLHLMEGPRTPSLEAFTIPGGVQEMPEHGTHCIGLVNRVGWGFVTGGT